MMQFVPPAHRPIISAGRRCRGLLAVFLMLAPALPIAAHAYTLDELLSMPLERLLQLEISPWRAVQLPWHDVRTFGVGPIIGSHRGT